MKKLFTFFTFSFLISAAWAQSQENCSQGKIYTRAQQINATDQNTVPKTVTNQNNLPAGFPVYVNTGNPEKDQADYTAAKEKWISENPDHYKKMNSKPATVKRIVSKEEFDKMPEDKKQAILSRPEQYEVK